MYSRNRLTTKRLNQSIDLDKQKINNLCTSQDWFTFLDCVLEFCHNDYLNSSLFLNELASPLTIEYIFCTSYLHAPYKADLA